SQKKLQSTSDNVVFASYNPVCHPALGSGFWLSHVRSAERLRGAQRSTSRRNTSAVEAARTPRLVAVGHSAGDYAASDGSGVFAELSATSRAGRRVSAVQPQPVGARSGGPHSSV